MMSAPQTNLEKQQRRHRGPLTGIVVVLAVVSVMAIGLLAYLSRNAAEDPPATPAAVTAPLPAEGAPATPLADPTPAPQVLETPEAPVAPAPAD
jgi:hypothetical protein